MKNLKLLILISLSVCIQVRAQESVEQQDRELGKCYRSGVPVLFVHGTITDQGNNVEYILFENQRYSALGEYNSNVALKNHLIGQIPGNWMRVTFSLDDPKPLSWFSSNMNFTIYDSNGGVFHEERLECRDAGM